jgi:hypothetical protein
MECSEGRDSGERMEAKGEGMKDCAKAGNEEEAGILNGGRE